MKIDIKSDNFFPILIECCKLKLDIIIANGFQKISIRCNCFFSEGERFFISGLKGVQGCEYEDKYVFSSYTKWIEIPDMEENDFLPISDTENSLEHLIWNATALPRRIPKTNDALKIIIESCDNFDKLLSVSENLNNYDSSILLLSRIVIYFIDSGDFSSAKHFFEHLNKKYSPRYLNNYPDYSYMLLKLIKCGIIVEKLGKQKISYAREDSEGDTIRWEGYQNMDYVQGIGFALRETTDEGLNRYIRDNFITLEHSAQIKALRDSIILPKSSDLSTYLKNGWITQTQFYSSTNRHLLRSNKTLRIGFGSYNKVKSDEPIIGFCKDCKKEEHLSYHYQGKGFCYQCLDNLEMEPYLTIKFKGKSYNLVKGSTDPIEGYCHICHAECGTVQSFEYVHSPLDNFHCCHACATSLQVESEESKHNK